jgi:tripeptidyl-peptidase-1
MCNATKASPGNKLGIFESLDVHYSKKDLDIYYTSLYPSVIITPLSAKKLTLS